MINYEEIPHGNYLCNIAKAEIVQTNTDHTNALKLELWINGQNFAGRKIWDFLCIRHSKPYVAEKAMEKYKNLLKCLGDLPTATPPHELIGRKIIAEIETINTWPSVIKYMEPM